MYTPCSRITLRVAMETMHFFIVQKSLSLRTKLLCFSGIPMNDLAPMKNCSGGFKVGQISSRGNTLVQRISGILSACYMQISNSKLCESSKC